MARVVCKFPAGPEVVVSDHGRKNKDNVMISDMFLYLTRQVTRATRVRNRVCPQVELILKIIMILLIIFLGFINSFSPYMVSQSSLFCPCNKSPTSYYIVHACVLTLICACPIFKANFCHYKFSNANLRNF